MQIRPLNLSDKQESIDAKANVAFEAARLLLGVARLGDMSLRGWWRSRALDFEGRFVLSNTFPRTGRVVGMELCLMSATRRHRQALGRTSAIHLYSDLMPFHRWTVGWLAEQKTSALHPLIEELEQWDDVDTASAKLAEWSSEPDLSVKEVAGALELGRLEKASLQNASELLERARRLAACYASMREFSPAYFNLVG